MRKGALSDIKSAGALTLNLTLFQDTLQREMFTCRRHLAAIFHVSLVTFPFLTTLHPHIQKTGGWLCSARGAESVTGQKMSTH